MLITIFLVLLV